jgi:hypothetical protein
MARFDVFVRPGAEQTLGALLIEGYKDAMLKPAHSNSDGAP